MELKELIPPHLHSLMSEGYVLWFHDNFRSRREMAKAGEQFWIEDGELYTKTVRMYKSKEISKGDKARYQFESELEQYRHVDVDFTLGDHSFRYMNYERLDKTLKEEFRRNFKSLFFQTLTRIMISLMIFSLQKLFLSISAKSPNLMHLMLRNQRLQYSLGF